MADHDAMLESEGGAPRVKNRFISEVRLTQLLRFIQVSDVMQMASCMHALGAIIDIIIKMVHVMVLNLLRPERKQSED